MGVDAGQWQAALAGLVACGAVSALVPRLIAAVPEPAPEPASERPDSEGPDSDETVEVPPRPPKEPYADIAGHSWVLSVSVVLGAVSGGIVGLLLGWDPALALMWPLVPVGVALAIIDARTRLLPRVIVLPATGVALLVAVVIGLLADRSDALVRAVVAAVLCRSVFWLMWFIRSSGMGFGDVRLAGLLGCCLGFVGWAETVVGFYAGFVLFILGGIPLAIVKRDRSMLKTPYPYGPVMLLGALVGLLVGQPVWDHLAR